jgi:hypothetical protein
MVGKYFESIPLTNITLDRIVNCEVLFLPFDETGNITEEGISVLFTILANGEYLKPQLLFKWRASSKFISENIDQSSFHVASAQKKLTREEIFLKYVEEILVPELQGRGVEFPIILYLDNPTCHFSFDLSLKCQELNVILISLQPNAKHFYQPCNLIFEQLIKAWNSEISKEDSVCSKETFSPILKRCMEKVFTTDTVKSCFEKCGLCWPLNPDIDYGKLKNPVPETKVLYQEDHGWDKDRYVIYERDLTKIIEGD